MPPNARKAKTPHLIRKPPLPKGRRNGPQTPADPQREELRNRVAIDAHLKRVHEYLTRYELSRRSQPDIFTTLDRIEEHEREQRLFLGVVGEFSSGKSTLLNALLRDDLLRTDVLQGTTAAATVISYGPALAVRVRPLPAHPVLRPFRFLWKVVTFPAALFRRPRHRDDLRALIHESSAVEKVARRVAQVDVSHPADCLKHGMVIVDLPGTNAENPRHGGVTAAALADFCDAAVVVVPADSPGSETLWDFLKNHLDPEVLRRCVFVLNKIDLLRRPRDRDQLAANLVARLKRDLHIDRPRVVPAAPERVLEAAGILAAATDPEFSMTDGERAQWVAAFGQTERLLWDTLREQKLLLQVERLARLLDQVFGLLTAALQGRDAEFRDRHAALQQGLAQIPNLEAFVAEAQRRHCGAYTQAVPGLLEECGRAIGRLRATTLRTLSQVVFGASNRKALQEALEGPARQAVGSAQDGLRNLLRAAVKDMEKVAEAQHRTFHDHFQTLYRNLATLGGRVRANRADLKAGAESFAGARATSVALAEGVGQLRKEELWKTAGGAGFGAVLGTMVLPGLGTLVGGVLGGIFGRLFGPSLDEVKQDCWGRLEAAVQGMFGAFVEKAEANLQRAAGAIHDQLAAAIGLYADKYRRLVNEMIERDRQEAADLTRFRELIERDLADLAARQAHLDQVRAHLRTL